MIKLIIGIDPGKHGALAVMDLASHSIIAIHKMPQTPADLIATLSAYPSGECMAYLEQVNELPKQSGMFEYGRNYGMIETSLAAVRIPHNKVTPQKWQKIFQLRKPTTTDKAKAYRERKAILKAKAQELFPAAKITLEICDAMLIAEYGYRQEK